LEPNCHLTDSPTTRVSDHAIHTADGEAYECDVRKYPCSIARRCNLLFAHYTTVVCATGFDVSHRPRFPIVGLNGIDLRQAWVDDPESYVSVAVPEIPNYFMMMGPNCLGGHGSLVESLNWTGDYFVKWIYKMATEDIKCVQPKWDKVKAFTRYTDQVHKKLVWSGGCKSWYKRNRVDGRVTALFGGSAQLFNRLLSDVRSEDFDIEYRTSNPFRFMGNGFTEFEMDPNSDLAWYVEKAEVMGEGARAPMSETTAPYGAQICIT
jgi:hypothetical protein